jgi:molecular chaperone GrpE
LSDETPADDASQAPEASSPAAVPAEVSAAAPAGESPRLVGSATELFEQRARAAEERLAEVVAAYRQLKQDNEGFRERTTRDFERRYERKRENLLMPFIEILDNLERALEAAQTSGANTSLIEGLILVRTQLLQTLQEQGLQWIQVRGAAYDPESSEVVDMEDVTDPDHNQLVIRELQRGYRLNGRIVRHAQVVVGRYQSSEDKAASEAPTQQMSVIQMPEEPTDPDAV